MFSLIYLLNTPHSNQNSSSFSLFLFSIASHLATFQEIVKIIYENKFRISFHVILLLPRDTDLCLVFMTKCIACLSFPGS